MLFRLLVAGVEFVPADTGTEGGLAAQFVVAIEADGCRAFMSRALNTFT